MPGNNCRVCSVITFESAMNCEKAQRMFDDLAHARLETALAREVREHLTDCTDCRVQHQRQARLQRLLALKRYEQPPAEFYADVVSDFHRRLAVEGQRPTRWERFTASVGLDSFLQPGYGWRGRLSMIRFPQRKCHGNRRPWW